MLRIHQRHHAMFLVPTRMHHMSTCGRTALSSLGRIEKKPGQCAHGDSLMITKFNTNLANFRKYLQILAKICIFSAESANFRKHLQIFEFPQNAEFSQFSNFRIRGPQAYSKIQKFPKFRVFAPNQFRKHRSSFRCHIQTQPPGSRREVINQLSPRAFVKTDQRKHPTQKTALQAVTCLNVLTKHKRAFAWAPLGILLTIMPP